MNNTSSGPNLTDERIRSWLNSNQSSRERMCLDLLALDPYYSHFEPLHPEGGPDGGRDFECVYQNTLPVKCAVGFRNNANDSNEDKRWVKRKFKADLEVAIKEVIHPIGFVFFTNVALTLLERENLKKWAKEKGVAHVEVYHREKIRAELDSTAGFPSRLKYLNISMTIEEQQAFVENYGASLENLVRHEFQKINQRVKSLEFSLDSMKEIESFYLMVKLDREYQPHELDACGILLKIQTGSFADDPYFICVSKSHNLIQEPQEVLDNGFDFVDLSEHIDLSGLSISELVWYQMPSSNFIHTLGNAHTNDEPTSTIACAGHTLSGHILPIRINNLHKHSVTVSITENLRDKIDRIGVFTDKYRVVVLDLPQIHFSEPSTEKWYFSPTEYQEISMLSIYLNLLRQFDGNVPLLRINDYLNSD